MKFQVGQEVEVAVDPSTVFYADTILAANGATGRIIEIGEDVETFPYVVRLNDLDVIDNVGTNEIEVRESEIKLIEGKEVQ